MVTATDLGRQWPDDHVDVSAPPGELAALLETWAFRREKVLALLDPRSAKRARALARACRLMEARPGTAASPAEAYAWLQIQEQVRALVSQRS